MAQSIFYVKWSKMKTQKITRPQYFLPVEKLNPVSPKVSLSASLPPPSWASCVAAGHSTAKVVISAFPVRVTTKQQLLVSCPRIVRMNGTIEPKRRIFDFSFPWCNLSLLKVHPLHGFFLALLKNSISGDGGGSLTLHSSIGCQRLDHPKNQPVT